MASPAYNTTPIRVFVASIALSLALGSVGASLERLAAQDRKDPGSVRFEILREPTGCSLRPCLPVSVFS